MSTQVDITEARRIHEAAQCGTWIVERSPEGPSGRNWLIASFGTCPEDMMTVHVTTENLRASETNGADADDDARAIAHYHNTYAALLDEVERLREAMR